MSVIGISYVVLLAFYFTHQLSSVKGVRVSTGKLDEVEDWFEVPLT